MLAGAIGGAILVIICMAIGKAREKNPEKTVQVGNAIGKTLLYGVLVALAFSIFLTVSKT